MNHPPTEEQQTILDAVTQSGDNLIIHALAGAAKTSTLVLIDRALPSVPKLALCFNVRIKKEMEDRFSGTVTTQTLNGCGHRVWGQAMGRRLVVEKDKIHLRLKSLVDGLPSRERFDAYDNWSFIKGAISHGKLSGWIPARNRKSGVLSTLFEDVDFFGGLSELPTELEERLIHDVSVWSVEQAFAGTIDFDDQVLMPTLFRGAAFPGFPLVLVDEAQDLSALNHKMLSRLVKKRVIAVGDEYQSIYGFRGAHQDSMELLGRTFSMRRLGLSVSFRCPEVVVNEAKFRAPNMKSGSDRSGSVKHLTEWSINDIPETATILCRNNAPLFSMAIALLRAGRYPELVGNDIGKNLIKVMEKLGKPQLSREEALSALEKWLEKKLDKSRDEDAKAKLHDQASCLKVFLAQGRTLGDALAYAKFLLTVGGPVKLMTGHKAKGLEWDNVFLLDQQLINMQYSQDRNLRYVMQTRSKENLYYVRSEDFDVGDGLSGETAQGSESVGSLDPGGTAAGIRGLGETWGGV